LAKREGIIAILAFLTMIGLKVNFADFLLMILFCTPLIADGVTALTDDEYNQAFHDRVSGTIIIQTRRGFSLDLKMKKWYKEARKTWENKRRKDR
jgi:hypothetical protein